jgi:hypothetical protein
MAIRNHKQMVTLRGLFFMVSVAIAFLGRDVRHSQGEVGGAGDQSRLVDARAFLGRSVGSKLGCPHWSPERPDSLAVI